MQVATITMDGQQSTGVELADSTFGVDYNEPLVHQVVVAYFAAGRAGSKAQKTRAEVRGGGKKPWRQKGTGHARAGSIRSPIWRGGGRAFAARPRNYEQKVNRKMYRGALRSVLSELIRRERLTVVDDFTLDSAKTKDAVARLKQLGLDNVLIVVEDPSENLLLATRNLYWVGVAESVDVNPAMLLAFDRVLMSVAALKRLEERLA